VLALALEVLLNIAVEILGQIVLEVAADLGIVSIRHALGRARLLNPMVAAFGLVIVGSVVGAVSAVARPEPMLPHGRVPGLSLVLAPLVTGAAMAQYGGWRRARGRDTTYLATFWGGAVAALAIAGTRYWLTR
jgi:hypothetical protein